MHLTTTYASPLGDILLASNGSAVTGLWFAGQRYFAAGLSSDVHEDADQPIFAAARAWLDAYFVGARSCEDAAGAGEATVPGAARTASRTDADNAARQEALPSLPVLELQGTVFRKMVWEELAHIPFGTTTSYGALAERVSARQGRRTSPRAVGSAVGANPVSLFIPCHRVLGADGALTGYAGGVWRKRALLALEQRGIAILEQPASRPEALIQHLAAVWEDSVRVTHDFLTEEDIARMRPSVPQLIATVPRLLVAWREGVPVGFACVRESFLDMLFVSPAVRGTGVGRLLFERAVALLGVRELSVNEQNPQAIGFYEHLGFATYRRTETDDQGEPFPLLFMRRDSVQDGA